MEPDFFDLGTFRYGWTALHTTCFIRAVFSLRFLLGIGDLGTNSYLARV